MTTFFVDTAHAYMSESFTPEQARNRSVAAMPAPLGEFYHWLHDELAWLYIKWTDYRRLYAMGDERVELLIKVAPTFFGQLQRTMWEDVLLHLCRLTDPAKSMGHEHLTILRIPDAIPDQALRDTVQLLVNDAKQKSQFARNWRNRHLAHKELPTPLGQVAATSSLGSRQNVEDALAAVAKTMNHIERHYLNQTVLYAHSIEALGGVESLIARLTKGISADEANQE